MGRSFPRITGAIWYQSVSNWKSCLFPDLQYFHFLLVLMLFYDQQPEYSWRVMLINWREMLSIVVRIISMPTKNWLNQKLYGGDSAPSSSTLSLSEITFTLIKNLVREPGLTSTPYSSTRGRPVRSWIIHQHFPNLRSGISRFYRWRLALKYVKRKEEDELIFHLNRKSKSRGQSLPTSQVIFFFHLQTRQGYIVWMTS